MDKSFVPKNYKTRPCKRFHEELYCPYGPRCQFKHKDEEITKNVTKEKDVAVPAMELESIKEFSNVLG